MSKVGRNEPCPCGSGKKYKKCCESKDLEAAAERARAHDIAAAERRVTNVPPSWPSQTEWVVTDDLEIDKLSNSVLPLIKEKRLDEALAACEQLRIEYPEAPDWLERSAMVHEARGNILLSLDFYRRMLSFTELPEQRDGYDEEIRISYREKISELEGALAARETSPTRSL
jgi:hypothetical protein